MAGYEKLAAEMQSIAERTATNRSVAAKAVDKLAIGRDFKASNITVTQPISEGADLIRHRPPDGDNYRISQDISDNSIQIVNDSTGNTSAYFYPNGKVFIDPLDGSIFSNHIGSLAGSKIQVGTLPGTRLQNNTLGFSNYGDASIGDQKLYDFGIVYDHFSNNAKTQQSQGVSSMRSLHTVYGGSSLQASPGNHVHTSVNFNSQYTLAEKEASASLVTQVRSMIVQPQIEPLRQLLLDVARQLMDEVDHDVVEKVRRIKEDRGYALEFRMKHDPNYYAAFMLMNNAEYANRCEADPRIQEMAAKAVAYYGKVEDDPVIVEDFKSRRPGWIRA